MQRLGMSKDFLPKKLDNGVLHTALTSSLSGNVANLDAILLRIRDIDRYRGYALPTRISNEVRIMLGLEVLPHIRIFFG